MNGSNGYHLDPRRIAAVSDAIAMASVYRTGTSYLHIDNPLKSQEAVPPKSFGTVFNQNSFGSGFEFGRTSNPAKEMFERAVASTEKAEYCVAFSSGSAATSAVILLLSPGERILSVDDSGGNRRYFRRIVSPRTGVDVDFADFADNSSMLGKLLQADGKIKLFWVETPTNPTLKVTNIEKVSTIAQRFGAYLAVDNTICSPYFQNPLENGADIVVHSATKYICGDFDAAMGVVCTNNEEIYEQLRSTQSSVFGAPSPFDCCLAHRGLKTLHLRMEAASRNAMAIALFLENHEGVSKVLYPGLESHAQHSIAKSQQHGYGAMITFYCIGGKEQSSIILQSLKVFALTESSGAVESTAECPSLTTRASEPDNRREQLGIDDTLIKLSIGVECCNDLLDDLDNALKAAVSSMAPKFLPQPVSQEAEGDGYWDW